MNRRLWILILAIGLITATGSETNAAGRFYNGYGRGGPGVRNYYGYGYGPYGNRGFGYGNGGYIDYSPEYLNGISIGIGNGGYIGNVPGYGYGYGSGYINPYGFGIYAY